MLVCTPAEPTLWQPRAACRSCGVADAASCMWLRCNSARGRQRRMLQLPASGGAVPPLPRAHAAPGRCMARQGAIRSGTWRVLHGTWRDVKMRLPYLPCPRICINPGRRIPCRRLMFSPPAQCLIDIGGNEGVLAVCTGADSRVTPLVRVVMTRAAAASFPSAAVRAARRAYFSLCEPRLCCSWTPSENW